MKNVEKEQVWGVLQDRGLEVIGVKAEKEKKRESKIGKRESKITRRNGS